jgi:feruloyl esterase
MGKRQVGLAAVCTALALSCSPIKAQQLSGEAACSALAELQLDRTHITQAELISPQPDYVVPGTEQNPPDRGGPTHVSKPFCRVAGTVQQAIRFEVWLPVSGWNGRFEGLGNGAFSGAIPYTAMAQALSHDFAVGGTDTGHQSGFTDATWTQSTTGLNTEVLADWSHRGMHEMSLKAQAVVQAFYGHPASHRYFVGCSSGGHQALTEAQRYPNDYDGILAGAPANYWTHLMAGQLWYGLATRVDPASNLEAPQNKLALIHAAVLKACDANDGVADGVIENPLSCKFDPRSLACKGADTAACLTAPQVSALRKIYGNAPAPGRKLFPGLAPGGEAGWASMSANQVPFAQTFYRYIVFQNPAWNFAQMQFAKDVAYADKQVGGIVNSVSPDLREFRGHGGKLLQYHGWNDPLISPYNSIDYYESVIADMTRGKPHAQGLAEVQDFHRLFMVPGMNHCRGGDGADSFDGLQALVQWVEKGEAPSKIVAAKLVDGMPSRTHPLCPYPTVAQYRGSGEPGAAENFECALP